MGLQAVPSFVYVLILVTSWQLTASSVEGNAAASKWPWSSGPAPSEETQTATAAPSDVDGVSAQSFTTLAPTTPAPTTRRRRRRRRRSETPAPAPRPRPRPRPRPKPRPAPAECTKGKKDIMIMIDASKSVAGGWSAEASFAIRLINEITRGGNPEQHALNVHYFNTDTVPIGPGSQTANALGTFSTDGAKLAQAVKSLQYTSIVNGATDHPQCFETAAEAFKKVGRSGAEKVLILITDGATHKGKCKGINEGKGANKGGIEMVAKKIGRCRKRSLLLERARVGKGSVMGDGGKGGKGGKGVGPVDMGGVDQSHPCGQPTGNDPPCSTQCMCGLYTAQVFKDMGYELNLVGIANNHHVGHTDAGVFNKIMRAMASPGRSYLAKNFENLDSLVKPLVSHVVCK